MQVWYMVFFGFMAYYGIDVFDRLYVFMGPEGARPVGISTGFVLAMIIVFIYGWVRLLKED